MSNWQYVSLMPELAPIRRYKRAMLDPDTRPLAPWEVAFAEWLSSQPVRPSAKEQVEKAQELAQLASLTWHYLKRLKRRKAFVAYWADINTSALKRARKMIEAQLPEAVRVHFQGMKKLEAAASENADLLRSIPTFTAPYLERAWPKKDETVPQVAVQINLSQRQMEALSSEDMVVEAEIVDESGNS
jgi:uncharacterized pyridoxal phosphate-containing UPF0001 family protein